MFGSGKLGFAGSTISAPGFRQRKYSQKALHIFRQTPYAGSADLRGPNAHDRARFFETGFSWEASEYPTSIDLLDVLAMHPGFIMAVAGDYFDRFWQSATPIDYYQTFNRPYEHLSKRQGLFGLEIDISENPGRASIWIERGVTLWAGASLCSVALHFATSTKPS